jgi:hypothetical protein
MVLDNLPVTVYDLLDDVSVACLDWRVGVPRMRMAVSAARCRSMRSAWMVMTSTPSHPSWLCAQEDEFVRPGFELGFKRDGKHYINNHLVFNILVYRTHGEYSGANLQYQNLAEAIDNRRRLQSISSRRALLGKGDDDDDDDGEEEEDAGSAVASGRGGSQEEDQDVLDAPSPDGKPAFYMIVGFEVAPCSIARKAGQPIEDVPCDLDDEEKNPPPQEVVEGAKIVYTYDVYWQVGVGCVCGVRRGCRYVAVV